MFVYPDREDLTGPHRSNDLTESQQLSDQQFCSKVLSAVVKLLKFQVCL